MDPHSFIARAEAQRWLGIAEKLLISNDFVGSKTFAIRARESDPRLEAADQILAITDTILAAEKPVAGNNSGQQPDYYAILQVVRFAQDTDHIAEQYRRLAVALNPNQNRFPYSDQAFQLVNDAWAVLSNPIRKSMYDSELNFSPHQQMNNLGFSIDIEHHHHQQQQQQQQQQQHHQQQHQHNFFNREQELPFQNRVYQQHNFMSQNPVISASVHETEHLFQPQVTPFQVNFPPQQHPPLSWPQQPPVSQPQQQQLFQRVQEQLQHSLQRNAAAFQFLNQISNENVVREEVREVEIEAETEKVDENVDESPTFWTTCPFCFYMYEHHKVYAEFTLRCGNCKRAFQAVRLSSPPQIIEGQEAYYCWGFFPLGVSMSLMQKTDATDTKSNWTPFSPLCDVSISVQEHLKQKKTAFVNEDVKPSIYRDDETDDIFEGVSEPSDDSDSDVEWGKKKKAKKMKKVNKPVYKTRAQVVANRSDKSVQHVTPTVPVTNTSGKAVGVNTRRQAGRGAKEMGKLDLNVEFNNNEGDDSAARVASGNRVNGEEDEDNIEGIAFFEGLDEFFSSLPILSSGKDEKVKAG